MSRIGFTEEGAELDKLIHNCEFENQQYVKLIEHESNLIQILEKEIHQKTDETKHLQGEISQLDADTKNYHRQFTINRDNGESLKKTNHVLTEHIAAMTSKLDNLRLQRRNENLDYGQTLKHYEHIWQRYKQRYESYPLARDLKVLQENKNELIASNEKRNARILELKKEIEAAEGKNELQGMDTKAFIIRLAEIQMTTQKIQREIEQRKHELAKLAETCQTQADSDHNLQKMTEIHIIDGEEEMEGEDVGDKLSSAGHSPMISDRDEEEVMQTDITLGLESAKNQQDPQLLASQNQAQQWQQHQHQGLKQQPQDLKQQHEQQQEQQHEQLMFLTQKQQQNQLQQQQEHGKQQQDQQRYHHCQQLQLKQQQQILQLEVPATHSPSIGTADISNQRPSSLAAGQSTVAGSTTKLVPPHLSVPRLQSSPVVNPGRSDQMARMLQVPRLQVPFRPTTGETHFSRVLQHQIPKQQLPNFSEREHQHPSTQISSQFKLQESHSLLKKPIAFMQHLTKPTIPQKQLPRPVVAEVPQQRLPLQSQPVTSTLQLPPGFQQSLISKTKLSPTKSCTASPLLLVNQPKPQELTNKLPHRQFKPQSAAVTISKCLSPAVQGQNSPVQVSPGQQHVEVPHSTSPVVFSQLQLVTSQNPSEGHLSSAHFSPAESSARRASPISNHKADSKADGSSHIEEEASDSFQSSSLSKTLTSDATPDSPSSKSLLGLGETFYLPLKDSNDEESSYVLTPEKRGKSINEMSPFNLEKHRQKLEALKESPGFPGFSADRRMFSEQKDSSPSAQYIGGGGDMSNSSQEKGQDGEKSGNQFTFFGANIADNFTQSSKTGTIINFGCGDAPSPPKSKSDGTYSPQASPSTPFSFGFGVETLASESNASDGDNLLSLFGTPRVQDKEAVANNAFCFSFGSSEENRPSSAGLLSMFDDTTNNEGDQSEESTGFTFSFAKSPKSNKPASFFKFF